MAFSQPGKNKKGETSRSCGRDSVVGLAIFAAGRDRKDNRDDSRTFTTVRTCTVNLRELRKPSSREWRIEFWNAIMFHRDLSWKDTTNYSDQNENRIDIKFTLFNSVNFCTELIKCQRAEQKININLHKLSLERIVVRHENRIIIK